MNRKQSVILVLDDLADWRATLRGLLEDWGYTVHTAGSTEQALRLLENTPVDLALLDIRLDETDEGNTEGLSLASVIKERWPDIKVVVITGYDTPDVLQKAMQPDLQGHSLVADYLPKVDTNDKLIQVIEKVLAKP